MASARRKARYGLFASLYTDRGSHYFTTPEAGGKVDKVNLTQVGRSLKQLGIGHIGAYSPEVGIPAHRDRSFWWIVTGDSGLS